ncbi:MAG: hypothetical protein GY761_18715 [Hyphomicrobiales bacterium]|nr:hypothetical protein [Hyphomicrobiales bacterium]
MTGEPAPIAGVSHAIAWRRHFGRTLRRSEFYRSFLGANLPDDNQADAVGFTGSFEEIIEAPPISIPENLKTKLAVLVIDMAKLGDTRLTYIRGNADKYQLFSTGQNVALKRMLAAVAENAVENDDMILTDPKIKNTPDGVSIKGTASRKGRILRLETLMLGGDEIMAVFPAWCVEAVMKSISSVLSESVFELDDNRFKIGAGLVICHYKTPIRLAKNLAVDLCNSAKLGAEKSKFDNGVQYHVAGHLEFPETNLPDFRRRVIYDDMTERNQEAANALTLDIETIAASFEMIREFKGESGDAEYGIPRTVIIDAVRQARSENALFDDKSTLGTVCSLSGKFNKLNFEENVFSPLKVFCEKCATGRYKRPDSTLFEAQDIFSDFLRGEHRFPLAALFHTVWLWSIVRQNQISQNGLVNSVPTDAIATGDRLQ